MEKTKLYDIWKEKYAIAKANMAQKKNNQGILIEVAAQHPLIHGEMPNEEFEKRLLLASEIYAEKIRENQKVWIYVPGSLHMDNGIPDKVSLSEAGKKYLIEKGIQEKVIFADEMNVKYKGDAGVYNSTDECYVAGKLF